MTKHDNVSREGIMKATEFVKKHGIEKARVVVDEAPDVLATHYCFRKIAHYYAIECATWFYDGEWHPSDCHSEDDLIDSYGVNFVVNLSDLKRLVESHELVNHMGGLEKAMDAVINQEANGRNMTQLAQAIADVEACHEVN